MRLILIFLFKISIIKVPFSKILSPESLIQVKSSEVSKKDILVDSPDSKFTFVNDFSFYLNPVEKERPDFYVFCHTNVYHYVNNVAQLVDDKSYKARFFVMDYKNVQKYKSTDKKGSDYLKLKSSVPNYESFEENWKLIKDFLN